MGGTTSSTTSNGSSTNTNNDTKPVLKVQIVYPDSTPDSTGRIILHYSFQICEIIILGYLGQYFLSQLDPRSQEKNNLKTTQSAIQKRLSAIDRSHVDASTFTTHENRIFADVKTPTEVMVSFAQIGGLSKHKEQIMNTLLANDTTRAKLRAAYGKLSEPAKGMLLHGPPGCGKTLLAKAIASECKAVFIELKISHVTDKWHGESQKLTDAVFSLARKLAPTIIFIDEVDTFLRDRGMRSSAHESSTTSQMKASFLSNWDGLTSDQTTRPMYDATTGEQIGIIQLPFEIIVIGATNRPGDIDEAFHRRMPAQFFIGMPNKAERTSILQIMFDQMSITPTCNPIEIANSTEHYSGSDLKELCRDAVSEVTNELCKNGSSNPRPLTLNDFNKVYHRKNPAGRASIAYKEKQIMEDRLKNNGRSFGGGMD